MSRPMRPGGTGPKPMIRHVPGRSREARRRRPHAANEALRQANCFHR